MIGDRKLLTKPSKPGDLYWDNEDYDLILHTSDVIYSSTKRYSVVSLFGKGTFGQVANCIDQDTEKYFAVKISKSSRVYHNCSRLESQILERLNKLGGSKHFVKIYAEFMFRQHHCIVLEPLGRNLYEMLKIRNFNGFSHGTVKNILRQLLGALIEMSKIGVVHCDLKPENILVENPKTMKIKIVDFGSAFYHLKESCFYVQSRYYRAPEVMMKMAYNSSVDIWSFVCIAFELYAGCPLFPGKSNSDQLSRIFYMLEENSGAINMYRNRNCENVDQEDTVVSSFLSKEDVRMTIYKYSKNKKDNQDFYDFLFLVLKVRAVERPDPNTILNYEYLKGISEHDETKVFVDNLQDIEARDQQHPPPQVAGHRRYTNSTVRVKEKVYSTVRKKSHLQGPYRFR